MTDAFSGGCRCGAVRYDCTEPPVTGVRCHCRECQKASGTGHADLMAVHAHGLDVTGEVRYFDHIADSGNTASNGFCATCGSHLFGKTSGMPGLTAIKVGSLDDPSWFEPKMSLFAARAQPWDPVDPNLPSFPGMPER